MQLTSHLIATMLALGAASTTAVAAHSFKGSDTLAGVINDAITASALDSRIHYLGGGSGGGETALVAKEQGLAPMSRAMKDTVIAAARAAGITPVPHVIGLDGLAIFVHGSNAARGLTLDQIKQIYTCTLTNWSQVAGSGRTGSIKVYRRNDTSGTTDAFKHFTGITTFGACVTVLAETADVMRTTSTQADALAYSGLSARADANKILAVAKDASSPQVLPTEQTVRNKTYPMSRELYVYEATGAHRANAVEVELLRNLKDRSFMDPIVEAHDFFTID